MFQSRRGLDLNPEQYIPAFGDEDIFLPAAEAFPEMIAAPPRGISPRHSLPLPHPDEQSAQDREASVQHRPRVPKLLPRDDTTELRSTDLARWHANYVENMISQARLKLQHRAPRLSKSNARLIVLESGIGGVGARFAGTKLSGPLQIFSGNRLLEALTGADAGDLGRKRPHEEGADSDTESRRVRLRESDGEHIGRGNEMAMLDDEALALLRDEVNRLELLQNATNRFPRTLKSVVTLRQHLKTNRSLGI